MGNLNPFRRPKITLVEQAVAPPPPTPDASEEAIHNAKLMERRRQLGMMGRQSTWLTGARGDTNQAPLAVGYKTVLGE